MINTCFMLIVGCSRLTSSLLLSWNVITRMPPLFPLPFEDTRKRTFRRLLPANSLIWILLYVLKKDTKIIDKRMVFLLETFKLSFKLWMCVNDCIHIAVCSNSYRKSSAWRPTWELFCAACCTSVADFLMVSAIW